MCSMCLKFITLAQDAEYYSSSGFPAHPNSLQYDTYNNTHKNIKELVPFVVRTTKKMLYKKKNLQEIHPISTLQQ